MESIKAYAPKTAFFIDISSRIFIILSPLAIFALTSWMDSSLKEFSDMMDEKFVSQSDASQNFISREKFSQFRGLTNLHTADNSIHLTRADVVPADVYAANRNSDAREMQTLREDIGEIKAGQKESAEKLDRLLEMMLSK